MDLEAVPDLPQAQALPAQGDGLFAEALEVGVLASDFRHAVIVVRNADVRWESWSGSSVRVISA
ncbi:hypothetical protein ACIA8E_19415 [Streptomyces sp. NPDC051664]|uniref:hypothetical protein n=1 Tax=Streptomyces sp. NPDC051664 TaxID=3365668 RepID=UPI0037B53D80